MSGMSFSTITQPAGVKSLEELLLEQDSVNSKNTYHELSKHAVEGSSLSLCMPRSDKDPNYAQRLTRILNNLKSQLAHMPEGEIEVREIDWQYGPNNFDIGHFLALAEKAHEYVEHAVMAHYEEQKRDGLLNVSNFEPPLPIVPRSIGALRSVTSLNLQDNALTELPRELFDLESLRALHLGGNRIKSLPEAIGRLRHLCVLNVEQNRLESLPRALENLTKLEVLRASNNRLTSFSIHIEKLNKLRNLYLYGNSISTITVYPALRLDCLHLEDNQLTRFPRVEVLPRGCQIYLSGNPLQHGNTTMLRNEALNVYFVEYVKPEIGKKRASPEKEVSNRQ